MCCRFWLRHFCGGSFVSALLLLSAEVRLNQTGCNWITLRFFHLRKKCLLLLLLKLSCKHVTGHCWWRQRWQSFLLRFQRRQIFNFFVMFARRFQGTFRASAIIYQVSLDRPSSILLQIADFTCNVNLLAHCVH